MTELSARETNRVITAVNCRQTPEEANLKTEAELALYKSTWQEAQQLYEHYGIWPQFALCELDW